MTEASRLLRDVLPYQSCHTANDTGRMDRATAQFLGGIALAILAAVLMLLTESSIAAPITLLIVGIVLIANSRRARTAG